MGRLRKDIMVVRMEIDKRDYQCLCVIADREGTTPEGALWNRIAAEIERQHTKRLDNMAGIPGATPPLAEVAPPEKSGPEGPVEVVAREKRKR